MPHATNGEMSQNLVNGDKNASQFLDHLTSYPVVSDSIETFKSNPYGKKSIELADSAYERFAKPVEPYLETPKQYAAPYAKKADELAKSGLDRVDNHFPIVKEDTATIVDKGKAFVWWPFKVVGDGKDYVWSTYNDEYSKTANHKNRGSGVTTLVLAIISTELKIASDFFQAVADFLGPKYEEGKQKGVEAIQQAQDTANYYKEAGKDKAEQIKNLAADKSEEYQKIVQDKKEEAKDQANKSTEQLKQDAQQTKDQAQKEAQKTKDDAVKEAQKTKEEAQKKVQK